MPPRLRPLLPPPARPVYASPPPGAVEAAMAKALARPTVIITCASLNAELDRLTAAGRPNRKVSE